MKRTLFGVTSDGTFRFRNRKMTYFDARSICDLVLSIDYLPEISRFLELLSAQVSYHGFRVPKVVPVLQTCMSILIEKKRS